jgi:hypothetical protein
VAAGLSLPVAINKAGRQRMLSQRTAKAWLMLVQGVLPERAKTSWPSPRLFEAQLASSRPCSPATSRALWLLEHDWGRYRPLAGRYPQRCQGGVGGQRGRAGRAHKLTVAYEKFAGSPAGRLVNLSGRQRMLSQRMAKAYFFRQMDVNAGRRGDARHRHEGVRQGP